MTPDEPRMDKTVLSMGTLDDDDARAYWRSRTPLERLEALEFLRQVMYGYDPVADRLQRVLEVVKLGAR
jgi:hypothetical protein